MIIHGRENTTSRVQDGIRIITRLMNKLEQKTRKSDRIIPRSPEHALAKVHPSYLPSTILGNKETNREINTRLVKNDHQIQFHQI
jgi:hypothetical protein